MPETTSQTNAPGRALAPWGGVAPGRLRAAGVRSEASR
jgi:hypothetical protein